MLKTTIFTAFTLGLAVPASANDTLRMMEKKLKVEPGVYTLGELYQIEQDTGLDRKVRIELINDQKVAFVRAVRAAMADN